MNLSTVLIVIWLLLLSHSCMSVTTGLNWTTAYEHCRTKNDSLVDILDVQNQYTYFKGLKPIWSSVKGHFTPWVAYRGCFNDENLGWSSTKEHLTTTTSSFILKSNTVGNCYFICKSNNNTKGGCANNVHFFFGLKGTICLCLCENNLTQTLSERSKCNSMCRESFSNDECGGLNHFSVYESTTIALPDAHFGVFCLTCRPQSHSDNTMLYSKNCNANAAGYCITRYGNFSLHVLNLPFDLYWRYCKNNNLYIVGNTSQIYHCGESSIWTGLRKYKIDSSNTDNDSCYIIEIQNEAANYNKRNCTEHHFFLCKHDIGLKNFSSVEYIKSTKNTVAPSFFGETLPTTKKPVSFPVTFLKTSIIEYTGHITTTSTSSLSSKSEVNATTVVGASVAGVFALISGVFVVICIIKRCKLQCMRLKQQAKSDAVFHNTTYDDLTVTNQKQDVKPANTTMENNNQGIIYQIDEIYLEKEEEYDHLHTSRKKKMTIQTDDDRYGSASILEDDSYSTLRQNKNVDPDLDDEYSVNSMPYSENQSSTVNSPEYDHCYQTNQRKDW